MNTPASERVHITIFGHCNSGKSALINALVGQDVAIVSDIAGTTTDPVSKSFELPGVGAVLLTDTAGTDDSSPLADKRIEQTLKSLMHTDIAVVILPIEQSFIDRISELNIPIIGVVSKADTLNQIPTSIQGISTLAVSAKTGLGIESLVREIALCIESEKRSITEHICSRGDKVILVMPQDGSAPKGRIIKPQVEVIRELLDRGCTPICTTPDTLQDTLESLNSPPRAIITDSSAFAAVKPLTPQGVTLTSFSILMARYKGDLELFKEGAKTLLALPATAKILIAEACSHTPQNEDIGRVKLPNLLRKRLGDKISITVVSGNNFPDKLDNYDIIIHCGACMFNRRHVMSRIAAAKRANTPITNYGVAIAALTGVF